MTFETLEGRHNAPKYFGANGDILNFAIYEGDAPTSSVLRMFSLSRIHGALGDNGQNYKTLCPADIRGQGSYFLKYFGSWRRVLPIEGFHSCWIECQRLMDGTLAVRVSGPWDPLGPYRAILHVRHEVALGEALEGGEASEIWLRHCE